MILFAGFLLLLTITSLQTTISVNLLPPSTTGNSSHILYEVKGFIIVYNNGTVERLIGTEVVPASLDSDTGVQSQDVVIAPERSVSARLFLPENVDPTRKLPLLVYFHGGAFCTGSPFSPEYHRHLNSLVAEAYIIAVSVNYRRAPENLLPIGYDDAWASLKWAFSHVEGNGEEAWLNQYADFGRVYLGGDSAGGNIAHNMAMWAGSGKSGGDVVIEGVFLNCPHFWGEKRIGNEDKDVRGIALMESIWVRAYPDSLGFDDPLVNPGMDRDLGKIGCKRVLVYVAEKDILKDRGWYYKKALDESGWNGTVEVVEVKGKGHVFNIISPDDPKAIAMLKNLASFLNHNN